MTIVSSVIGGLILLIQNKMRQKISPKAHYFIWLVFIVSLMFPIAIPSKISIYNLVNINKLNYEINSEESSVIKFLNEKNTLNSLENNDAYNFLVNVYIFIKDYIRKIIAFALFLVTMTKLVKTMISYIDFIKATGDDEVKDENVICILESCKSKLKIKRNMKIINQVVADTPAIIGIIKPRILVTDLFLELDEKYMENVFLHELSHYKRKDNILNFIILILKSIYWFNPLFNFLFQEIKNDLEFATDEMVINFMNSDDRTEYCRSLVQVAAMNTLDMDEVLGISSSAIMLRDRVNMIFSKEKFETNRRKIFLYTVCIVILMIFVFYPTSYGEDKFGRIFIKTKNWQIVELIRDIENYDVNEIRLPKNSKIKLLTENINSDLKIYYKKTNLENMKMDKGISQIFSNKLNISEEGEYIYSFTVVNSENESAEYFIKIIVE